MSLVELFGEHAHHREVAVPTGEENVAVRPHDLPALAVADVPGEPVTELLHRGLPVHQKPGAEPVKNHKAAVYHISAMAVTRAPYGRKRPTGQSAAVYHQHLGDERAVQDAARNGVHRCSAAREVNSVGGDAVVGDGQREQKGKEADEPVCGVHPVWRGPRSR
nr:hypothetical protein HEP87_10185 [Streptomyces sp. S1D4-11]